MIHYRSMGTSYLAEEEANILYTPVSIYANRQTILDTDDKLLVDDVTVLEIPYTETSNQYGTTIAIATE